MRPGRYPIRCAGLAALLSLLSLLGMLASAAAPDPVRGAQVYGRCLACHAFAYDRVGPRHCGLIGRRAATIPGFDYSPAMKKSGLVWDEKTLNLFLKEPLALVPHTSMTYDGIADASERRDLIAYLKQVNSDPVCRAK